MPQRFVVTREQGGERLDKALAGLMPEVSRATIQRWIGEGRVRLNGGSCRARDSVTEGDHVEVEAGPAPPSRAVPDASVEVDVVYEDSDLVVVNKPAGLVVHPGRGHSSGTLVNGLLALPGFGSPPSDPLDPEGPKRPGIVHRIDKDTSGLLAVAKNPLAREGLKSQLAEHSVDRLYQALTLGVPAPGLIRTLHGRHPYSRVKFTSRVARGREAVTEVSVAATFWAHRAALVECRLQTGRTHQIRVHLAEQLQCPILADQLYGRAPEEPELRALAAQLGRQALHAGVLGFTHPRTEKRLTFEVPLPADMRAVLDRLRGGESARVSG